MTMPKFDPVAWLRDTLDGGLSTMTDCCTNVVKEIWLKANPKNVERYTAPLYTADQLTEAYEAGKLDAIPEGWVLVPKEPIGWTHSCPVLCLDGVELWIDRCPHCGKPAAAPKGEE